MSVSASPEASGGAGAALPRPHSRGRPRALALSAAVLLAWAAGPASGQEPVPDILAFRFTLAGAAAAGPVTAGGRIWIVSEDRTLYVLDDSGRAVGRRPWRDGNPAWIAPDAFGRALLPGADGSLIMVNRAGLEVYRVRPGGAVSSAPAFGADGRFFTASGSRLSAFSASGRPLWSSDQGAPISLGPSVRFPPDGGTRITVALENGTVREFDEYGSALFSVEFGAPPSAWAALGGGLLLLGRDGRASALDAGGRELFRTRLDGAALAADGADGEAWVLLPGGRAARILSDGSVSGSVATGVSDARGIRVFPERVLVLGPRGVASLARDGRVFRDLALRNAPRMPAVTESGVVLSAGEDWILYAYRFEGPLGRRPAPPLGYVDFQEARLRAEEEALWNPDFGTDDGVLRELRRIEKSLGSASIGAGEADAQAFCSAVALGFGVREPSIQGGAAPSGPRPAGALPRSLACDILGLLGSPRAVPVLTETYLRDPDPAVRASAARALGSIGLDVEGQALRAFQWAADREFFLDEGGCAATIEAVEGIYRALGELADPGGVRALMRLAEKPYGAAVRSRALSSLRKLSEPVR